MTKMIQGDILTPNVSSSKVVVCHQVNCMGVMGSGLALQVKQQCPEAYNAYRKLWEDSAAQGISCLGQISSAYIPSRDFTVANLYGQQKYGMGRLQTNYDALASALRYVAQQFPGHVIRIPYLLGCFRGGGKWEIVEKIIRDELGHKGFDVEIWKFNKG